MHDLIIKWNCNPFFILFTFHSRCVSPVLLTSNALCYFTYHGIRHWALIIICLLLFSITDFCKRVGVNCEKSQLQLWLWLMLKKTPSSDNNLHNKRVTGESWKNLSWWIEEVRRARSSYSIIPVVSIYVGEKLEHWKNYTCNFIVDL